jgi:signal transduction histidine kinase
MKYFGGISFFKFYIITCLLLDGFYNIFMIFILKRIVNWKNKINNPLAMSFIRKQCQNLPYSIYLGQIIIPTGLVLIIDIISVLASYGTLFDGLLLITISKIVIMVFSITTLIAVIGLVFSKRIFKIILLNTYSGGNPEGIRISLKREISLQILPIFIVAILFTSLVGYSKLIDEKGDLLFEIYKNQLVDNFKNISEIDNINQIKLILAKIKFKTKGCTFIITPEGKVITSDGSTLSLWFMDYLNILTPSHNGQVCDATRENQGAIIKIKGSKGYWTIGIKYGATSIKVATFFSFSFLALLIINILVLSYFSKSLTDDISLVADNLSEIAEGAEVDLEKKIPVTSNDEIGDLVMAFNKIQDREIQHIKDIEESQRVLLERERLATLGQMIGGIAHNLRSPIMSIAGALEALKDLVKEYDDSVDNDSVTKEDHHEIATEMSGWVDSMKPYCSFMSDLISAVREQAVQLNASTYNSFTLEELLKRIEILLKFELKRNNCTIETDVQVDLNTTIRGEVNNLVQVCNNLIINAIQSYSDQGGKIEFKVTKRDHKIQFTIQDYGKGMPPEVKTRLLKEMVTTKGKRGTGLGLFMSSLTIKGRFGGDLWFESEEGKGSMFYFSIPC